MNPPIFRCVAQPFQLTVEPGCPHPSRQHFGERVGKSWTDNAPPIPPCRCATRVGHPCADDELNSPWPRARHGDLTKGRSLLCPLSDPRFCERLPYPKPLAQTHPHPQDCPAGCWLMQHARQRRGRAPVSEDRKSLDSWHYSTLCHCAVVENGILAVAIHGVAMRTWILLPCLLLLSLMTLAQQSPSNQGDPNSAPAGNTGA